ncbi:DUF448 domain-containing protein [Sandarakinorhabdus sp.]|uniref:DUF448 domain-containing protein n=1 Tax=Sandarakinorhabdus sp. TaxID=1916663 RepID=UPI00286E4395|nr:DUF448 domain-containing protein [Sandarakinorhabdus sp.]
MEPNDHLIPDTAGLTDEGPERRCILTQAHGPRASLIRLAVGPEGQVAADLGEKLPGRGAWIAADRVLFETAEAKGRLRGALARAFKSNTLTIPDDLADRIAAGLERRAMDRLGLENRAGNLIWGHERISDAIVKGKVALLIHAADARPDGVNKLESRRRAASPDTASCHLPIGRDRLSMALGRDNVVHAALVNGGSASRVLADLARWAAFSGHEPPLAPESVPDDADETELDDSVAVTGVAVTAAERH